MTEDEYIKNLVYLGTAKAILQDLVLEGFNLNVARTKAMFYLDHIERWITKTHEDKQRNE